MKCGKWVRSLPEATSLEKWHAKWHTLELGVAGAAALYGKHALQDAAKMAIRALDAMGTGAIACLEATVPAATAVEVAPATTTGG